MPKRFKDERMELVISRLIRSLMVSEGVSYEELCQKLNAEGVVQTPSTLRTKVSGGSLGAPLFMHILGALGVARLDVETAFEKYRDLKS